MYFLAGLLTENREGGRAEGRSRLEQVSPPLPPAAPPEEETSCRLRCKPRGLCRRLAGSPGPGCGDAGAAPGAYLPFRNIIPGKFRLREGEGEVGRGGDKNRGRRFQPGSSSHTQRLPLTARGGGWIEGCSVYPEGCMSRGNGPPRSQIFKNPQAAQPAWPSPLGRSRAARQSAVGRRQEPGISHPRGPGSRGGRRSGSGRRPATSVGKPMTRGVLLRQNLFILLTPRVLLFIPKSLMLLLSAKSESQFLHCQVVAEIK